MNISEIYLREVYLKKFCEDLEESLQLSESDGSSTLTGLLQKADEIIFPRFGIKPTDKNKYFIGGSARLHLYPEISSLLNDKPGDLDIVIPGQAEWDYLVKYLDHNKIPYNKEEVAQGIFRPEGKEGPIEAFREWDPAKADPEKYKDTKFTPTQVILRTSNRKSVGGHYFMTLYDILDYKLKLNRDKEAAITQLLSQYIEANNEDTKQDLRQKIITLFAGDEAAARSFLAPALVKQIKKS
jgi:hypothetical protein